MAREKATLTVDREKLERAKSLLALSSLSQTVDVALERLIHSEQLRRDVAAYAREPLEADELDVTDLPVELDLGDGDVDYDSLYGESG
ncbi:MAG: hypothetical protein ICV67_04625 [Thermoleophilia bacterium]|nr:hypothetical protein [Thermoleophilia bacterium]